MFTRENAKEFDNLRYVLYARKSTEDSNSQVKSLDDQVMDCQTYAQSMGLNVVEVIRESASAKTSNNRPLFNEMILNLEKGKRYDAILAWHPDRLSRNSLEAGKIVDLVDNDLIKDLKFPTLAFTNNASGKLLLNIMFAMSKQYSEHLSENVLRGVGTNRQQGRTSGNHRWGYETVTRKGQFAPDENFDHIRHCFDIVLKEGTQQDALDYLKMAGVHYTTKTTKVPKTFTINSSALSRILNDEFYYGILGKGDDSVNLLDVDPEFKLMVTKEEFLKVQDILRSRRRRVKPAIEQIEQSKEKVFIPFNRFIRCAHCGNYMYGSRSKARNGKYYLYYTCRNKECSHNFTVRGNVVLEALIKAFESIPVDDTLFEAYRNESDVYISDIVDNLKSRRHSLNAQLTHKKQEIAKLSLQYAEACNNPEVLPVVKTTLRDKILSLEDDRDDIVKELNEINQNIYDADETSMTIEDFTNLLKMTIQQMRLGNSVTKDTLARKFITNLYINDKKEVSHLWREPLKSALADDQILHGWG